MARAHRIGQTRAVKVYRLLTAKTYEMHMFHSASMKLGLDRAVLAHQRQKEQNDSREIKSESEKESHAKEIDQLLKKGAYDVFRDEDDTEAKQFMETNIDQLLERSSRTVTYGNTGNSFSNSLGSFSKASFVTSAADGKDVDLDDPDFWSKAVGLQVQDDDDSILINEKRSRKQVQVFDPYATFVEEEQKKKEKLAQKIQLEKEEKKRLKVEQKIKREEEKERKKKQREEIKATKEKIKTQQECEKTLIKEKKLKDQDASNLINVVPKERKNEEDRKLRKEIMNKKCRRDERKKLKRELMRGDQFNGRMKQAWDSINRDKVLSFLLKFGFGRMCKIRNEASMQSIPLHDIETFLRACKYLMLVDLICFMSCTDKTFHLLFKVFFNLASNHMFLCFLGRALTITVHMIITLRRNLNLMTENGYLTLLYPQKKTSIFQS